MAKLDPVDNFDDLLNFGSDEPEIEDPEDAEIRELEALVNAPLPEFEEPAPELDEVAEQKRQRIKELKDQLAKRNAMVAENAPLQYQSAEGLSGEKILIHIQHDGFVALGEVWHRGQELEFVVGSPAYNRTLDRDGNSWVSLAGDVRGQEARWGRQYLGLGPFIPRKGEAFDDEVARQDARRKRAVPLGTR